MLTNFILAFWHTLRSLLANINFTVTSSCPQKLGIVSPHQNLLLQTHHLPGGLSDQPLPKLEAALQNLLYFSQFYCFFSRPGQGVVPSEVHLLQVHQLVMMVPPPTNSQPCIIPATAARPQLVSTQTLPCSLQLRIPTFDPQLQVIRANPARRVQSPDDLIHNLLTQSETFI